jgi:hypothetical protein
MKLYKILEEIILEERRLLTEGVSDDEIIKAIEGKYMVNIDYDESKDSSGPSKPSQRYIAVYNLGTTKANNKAIRVFQVGGFSKSTPNGAWKTLRVDRIIGWRPTKMKFYRPASDYSNTIPKFNERPDGQEANDSPMKHVDKFVKFDRIKYPKGADAVKKDSSRSEEMTDKEREEYYTKKFGRPLTNKEKKDLNIK